MEPEIARRCPKCGASVRSGAFFCPQCGTPVKARTGAGNSTAERVENPAPRPTEVGGDSAMAAQSNSPEVASGAVPLQETFDPQMQKTFSPEIANEAHAPSSVPPVVAPATPTPPPPPVVEAERDSRRHRISSAREAVGEKIAPRMEKLRQASNVMLDEAAYDPSLRFVLVAVALLALTVLLFILHGLIG